ncbi:MAG: C45 family autoproteolytic acyltransferase/hydrolase [Deltaproteobacteria bacterium]|nr:C45 family autoproteolytic acyltransferase/hydrolase [Deltaproteobacteria bacterium]
MESVPILELKGQGLALGRAHGEALRDKITEFVETAHRVHLENVGLKIEREDLLTLSQRNLGFFKNYSPILFEELEGIAQGSNRSLIDIILINSFLELEDLRAPALGPRLRSDRLWGCTSFNVKAKAASDGPIIGQTYDMEAYYARFNAVLKITKLSGQKQIIYTLAGILGLNGLNSDGLALVINKLVARDARPGVIYPFVVRKALDQQRIGDAFGAVAFCGRATAMNYQLNCADSVAFCLETTATRFAQLDFSHSLAHSNHFLHPDLKPLEESGWLSHGGSYVRLQVAQEILDQYKGRLDSQILKTLCRNHVNRPRSICAHGYPDEPDYFSYASISAVIIEPSKALMHFCGAYPCQNEFQTITI